MLRDARAVNDKVRLLAKLGSGADRGQGRAAPTCDGAVAAAVGWDKLAAQRRRGRTPGAPGQGGPPGSGGARLAGAAPARAAVPRCVPSSAPCPPRQPRCARSNCCSDAYRSGGRRMAAQPTDSFLRPAWRDAVLSAGQAHERRIWEAATLLALRDRLRAGDIWVEGSRQWRAVEDQLIPPALFTAMREAGPLPVAVPATARSIWPSAAPLLDRRLAEVAAKAAADSARGRPNQGR